MKTVADIRYEDLLLLNIAGSVQAFAEKVERAHSRISCLKNRFKHSESGRPREIGDDCAVHVERQLGLAGGWMGQPQADHVLPQPAYAQLADEVAKELSQREVGLDVRAAIRQLLQSSPLKKRSNQ